MKHKNITNNLLLLIAMIFSIGASAQCPNSYTIYSPNQPSCPTSNNGSLSLNYTTYYSGATYLWSNGSTNRSQYNLPAGHYSVTVTDPTTCVYVDSFYLSPSPTGLVVNTNFYNCNSTLTSYPSGAVYPVSYAWSNGSTDQNINTPVPGVYTLQITDATGCSGTGTHIITPYPSAPISFSHTSTPASCGANNGTVDITITGGLAPFTYYWYGTASGSTEDVSNAATGNARLRVQDATGCYYYYTAPVGGPSISTSSSYVSCGQTNNGTASVVATDMTNPTYLWSNGATSATISSLTTGTYTVSVTDGGCIKTANVYIYDNGYVNTSIYDSTQNCSITEIEASTWGGAASGWNDYTYLWNTGETTRNITIAAGTNTYSVTATDINGCSDSDTLTVTAGNNGAITGVITDATCGNSDGAVDVTINNGYQSVSWSPTGATTEDITNIAAGFHTITVRTWNGCDLSETFQVGEFIEFETTDASCGLNNGEAIVHDYGMTTPTFLWSTGATVNTLSNLAAGDYYVTVTNGTCVIIDTATVNNAGFVSAGIDLSSQCLPDWATAVPTNGAAPYTFAWSTGAITQSIPTPTPGSTYSVSITDANGCTDNTSLLIPNPPALSGTAAVTDATCNNKNGAIDLTVIGGTAPFNFNWSHGGANIEDITGLWPGQYAVGITDNAGCTHTVSAINVGGQTSITVSSNVTPVNSNNQGGAIDITVNNVASPTFAWSNGANTEDISGLIPGLYRVNITDGVTGCVFTRDYRIYPFYTGNTAINIKGYVYDIAATGTCAAYGALPLPYKMVRLMPGNIVRFTDANGRYSFTTSTPGNYTVELITSGTPTISICPNNNIIYVNNTQQGNCYASKNFYVRNPASQDLSLDLWDWSLASPGFPYYTRVKYCNDGNTTMNGTVTYDYNSLLGFQSITGNNSTLTLHDIPNHLFNWSFSNLLPAQCRYLDVRFTVPASTALGTGLQGTATVNPVASDATPANNTDGEFTTVVGSWDPNDKQVEPYHTGDAWNGGIIYQADEELEYTIRFQNTGTAPASLVVIRDTLDANLLPESIRNIDTKHDATISIENGNILVVTFNNIYLPDSSADFEASMGFVRFDINRVAGLPIGTQIENTAAIYFDFNAPIITNTPISIIGALTNTIDIDKATLEMEAMPNPFDNLVTLKYTLTQNENVTVRIHNSIGQTVKTYMSGQNQAEGVYIETINTQDLPSGVYMLTLETANNVITKKMIKK